MKRALILFTYMLSLAWCKAQSNLPVDLRTGDPKVEIPLLTISEKNLSIPISLIYTNANVKVEDGGNAIENFGIGWRLLGGGQITRKVRDLPDDYKSTLRKGWLIGSTAQTVANYTVSADNNVSTCSDEIASWNDFNNGVFQYTDTEPDEFSFELPGLSGKFYFDANKAIRTVPYMDVKITPSFATPAEFQNLKSFTITTNEGVSYQFALTDLTKRYIHNVDTSLPPITAFKRTYNLYQKEDDIAVNYNSTFYLTSIYTPEGALIYYSYGNPVARNANDPISVIDETNNVSTLYEIYTEQTQRSLSSISTSTVGTAFEVIKPANSGEYKLAFYDVSSREIKSFVLTTVDIGNLNTATEYRKFLKSIQETTSCYKFPSYYFDYDRVDWVTKKSHLPSFHSMSKDFYGSFNNASNLSIFPTIYVYNNYNGADRFRIYPIPGVVPSLTLSGANRDVNIDAVTNGSLIRITYPPGGSTSFEYELNDFHDQTSGVSKPAGGIRVKRVTTYNGLDHLTDQIQELDYLLVNGQSSGQLLYPLAFTFGNAAGKVYRVAANLYDVSTFGYQRISLKQSGKGKTVIEYNMPAMFPSETYDDPGGTDYDWSATYNKILRLNCESIGTAQTGYYSYPFSPSTVYDIERGLISKIFEYSETNVIMRETQYDYQRISPLLIPIRAFRVESTDMQTFLGEYKILANANKVLATKRVYTTDPTSTSRKFLSTSSSYYESSNHKLVSHTTISNSDGTIKHTRYKYAGDFPGITNPNDEYTIALQWMNANNLHGKIVETTSSLQRGSTETTIDATLVKYKAFGSFSALPAQIKSLPNVSGLTPAMLQSVSGGQKLAEDSRYKINQEFLTYDNSKPTVITDGKKSIQSTIWGYNQRFPVVSIQNALPAQVVYTGFETPTNYDFSYDASLGYAVGYTGAKSLLTTSILKVFDKNSSNRYRFTAMIRTATSMNITIQMSNTVPSTSAPYYVPAPEAPRTNVTFAVTGQTGWQLFEAFVDLSTVTSSKLYFKLFCSQAILFDDIVLAPVEADISLATYDPAFGKTSISNANGDAQSTSYDMMGRIRNVSDRYGNILRQYDYKFQGDFDPVPDANFNIVNTTFSVSQRFRNNDILNFVSDTPCTIPVTHHWYVNGNLISSSPGFTYKVTGIQIGTLYNITHVVTYAAYGSKTSTKSILVFDRKLNPMLRLEVPILNVIDPCQFSYKRWYFVEFQDHAPKDFTYKWEVNINNVWTTFVPTVLGAINIIQYCQAVPAFKVRCTVTGFGITEISNELSMSMSPSSCPIGSSKCN